MAVASEQEVIGAQSFLRAIGADATDNNLAVAVVSWFRQESGSIDRVIGNNPFNIRPGVTSSMASGVRQTGSIGSFLIFPDLATGFAAAATLLKALAPSYGYGAVIKAAQSGDAVSFLAALALSSWDAAHYGVTWRGSSQGGTSNARTLANHLLGVYSSFTGLQLPSGATVAGAKVAAPAAPLAEPNLAPLFPPALPSGWGPLRAFPHRFNDARLTAEFYRAKHPLRKA